MPKRRFKRSRIDEGLVDKGSRFKDRLIALVAHKVSMLKATGNLLTVCWRGIESHTTLLLPREMETHRLTLVRKLKQKLES